MVFGNLRPWLIDLSTSHISSLSRSVFFYSIVTRGDAPEAIPFIEKSYVIAKIRALIPVILDLERMNYDSWRELFETHCYGFDVTNHLKEQIPNHPTWKNGNVLTTLSRCGSMVLSHLLYFRCHPSEIQMQYDTELRNIAMGTSIVTEYCTIIQNTCSSTWKLGKRSSGEKHCDLHNKWSLS
ncbi:hypothetical protein Lser_V15G25230 [Lactuca serriola]